MVLVQKLRFCSGRKSGIMSDNKNDMNDIAIHVAEYQQIDENILLWAFC